MPSVLARAVTLAPHPESRCEAVRAFTARVLRVPDGMLAVTYAIEGELERLRLPSSRPARAGARLWEHTCCELFIARQGMPGYHEFNLAPSGEWAVYAFARYRENAHLEGEVQALDPEIQVRRAADKLEVNALIRLERLSPAHAAANLSLGLAAVVEDQAGRLSYWSAAHAPGAPDFHHPDAFALTLGEARD